MTPRILSAAQVGQHALASLSAGVLFDQSDRPEPGASREGPRIDRAVKAAPLPSILFGTTGQCEDDSDQLRTPMFAEPRRDRRLIKTSVGHAQIKSTMVDAHAIEDDVKAGLASVVASACKKAG